MPKALIIGAGPAGLTAAYELSKSGGQSTVLEADNQVGGISRTVNYQGFRFDIGGHRFFTKIDYVQQLWDEILGDDFLKRPRLSRIFYRNRFYDYPLKVGNTLKNLGLTESFLVGMSYLKTQMAPYPHENNFEQWVVNRFGERLYRIFFKTYTEKVWGIPCSEISADWAAQRIKNLSLTEALKNAISSNGHDKNGEIITTLIEEFYYPRLGPGMMWEACTDKLAQRGNRTLLNYRVEKLRHHNGRVQCAVARTRNGERLELDADDFISTMPLRELIFALQPPPPDDILRAASNLRYRDYLTVVLVVDREHTFPDNWIYVHSPEVKLGRVQNYKNWSPHMVPDPSATSLGLEYFLWEQDDEWRWPDERLIEMGISEAEKIGLVARHEIKEGTVVRMKKAYPIYDHNYKSSLHILREYLASFSNLQTIGRNGLHRYNNQDHSMLTGVYAARNILGESLDVWTVNTEQEYHEGENGRQKQSTAERLYPTTVTPGSEQTEELEQMLENALAPLQPVAMGMAVGIVCAAMLVLATAWLLIKGGDRIGPHLSLLGQYLVGYSMSWSGLFVGMLEAGVGGFCMGSVFAKLRNWGVSAYTAFIKYTAD